MKTFHVITKYISQYNDSSESDNSSNYYDRYDSSGPLYAFESLEEAQYVLHLLQEEDPTETYELHTLNNDHPFPKLSEEEMLEKRLTRDIHERAHKRAQEEMKKQYACASLDNHEIYFQESDDFFVLRKVSMTSQPKAFKAWMDIASA